MNMLRLSDHEHASLLTEELGSSSDDFIVAREVGPGVSRTATAYNHVGDAYTRYADGESAEGVLAPANRFARSDGIVWEALCTAIDELHKAGVSTIRILDAGCGPGIWTKKIAEYARRNGLAVAVVGFDISRTQLDLARSQAAELFSRYPNDAKSTLEFLEHDLEKPLPWENGYFHIVLCNYAVLNHIAESLLPRAIAEICRVASVRVMATMRAVGSPASACIIGMEHVREYRNDPSCGQLSLVLKDGSQHRLPFNMYSAQAIEGFFAAHSSIVDIRALDVFVSRFAADENWNASLLAGMPDRLAVVQRLKEMEDTLCRLPGWVDHGTHILVVVQPKSVKDEDQSECPADSEHDRVVTSFQEFLKCQGT
jgi:SAM-dependent methyltransferase